MDEHRHHGPGFTNGFLLGVIVGALVVFLLATKKGKRILKTLTENGIEGISDLREMMDEDILDEEPASQQGEEDYTAEGRSESPKPTASTHPIKRFFKGTKK